MFTDVRGHSITTAKQSAAELCDQATEKFIRRRLDVMPCLQESLAADPDCAFTQAVFGLMLHGARNVTLDKPKAVALDSALRCEGSASSREKLYVSALKHALAGDYFGSVSCFENILKDNPTDLLALSLAQTELFWLGEMAEANRISGNVAQSWNNTVPGYSDYLGIRAFDLEETGHYDLAESTGREAVDVDPENTWGAHAVAHVLIMQGRHDEGVSWLQGLHGNWSQSNQLKFHLWWHQCLFHLERKEFDAVLAGYDRWIRNHEEELTKALPDLYIDLQNGSSMLWRLEHAGVDVGNRWQEMADLVLPRLNDMTSPFTSAHFALILAAVGQYADCDTLLRNMAEFAEGESAHTLAKRYREAAIPAAKGAILHRSGDYAAVVDVMLPARNQFWQMGGSHAQQDLFYQILIDAAFKAGREELVKQLLTEIDGIGFNEPALRVAYETASGFVQNR